MPLPKELLEKIKKDISEVERIHKEQEKDLQDAKRAGIDVDDLIKEKRRQEQEVAKLKMVYGKK